MKVTDIRRKLRAALVAGGLMAPGVAHAADLNANLVVNGGFENVDLFATSFYNAPLILDWSAPVQGFAYSHDLSGMMVPDFANGGPLASGGHWYFSPGNGGNHSLALALSQDIDVSTGPTAAAISANNAQYNLSAFFSTYSNQADRGFVQAEFLDGSQASLGVAMIASPVSPALATWTQFSSSGTVPAGTLTVRMSSWGEVFVGSTGSADGYTDNIDFRITAPLAADFDMDDDVDGADFLIWQRGLGTSPGATKAQGNADGDGDVDAADLQIWRDEFGGSALAANESPSFGPLVTAVPEPSSVLLVGIGLAAIAATSLSNRLNSSVRARSTAVDANADDKRDHDAADDGDA